MVPTARLCLTGFGFWACVSCAPAQSDGEPHRNPDSGGAADASLDARPDVGAAGGGGSSGAAGAGGAGPSGGTAGRGGSGGLPSDASAPKGGVAGGGGVAGAAGAAGAPGGRGGVGGGPGGAGGLAGGAGRGGLAGLGGGGGVAGLGGLAGSGGSGGGGGGGPVDPRCPDGKAYDGEVLPQPVDIADLLQSFTASDKLGWSIQVLRRRYPTGATILEIANNDTKCFDVGMSGASTAAKVIAGLRTSVHECGHMVDLNKKRWILSPTLEYTCDPSTLSKTPARKIIVGDEFQSKWPKDEFKADYLDNLGDQTFDSLVTESLQYINTLATSYAMYDQTTFDPIARDGVHAFQWYVTRYLHKVRLTQADQYEKIASDACFRPLVLAGWGRAQRYLAASKGMKDLSSADDALLQTLIQEPALVEEIDRLRDAEKCR